MAKRSHKVQNIITLIITIGIIAIANVLSYYVSARIDLTADKRYTLSPASKKLLGELKDVVFFKVYLEGDFPPGFRRLRNETRELLNEMRIYAKGNLEYEFIDPSSFANEEQRKELYKQLSLKGLFPTTLEEQSADESSQKIIFPGALVSYNTQEIPLQLLKDQFGTPPEEMLNNSIRGLEYEIAATIRKITAKFPPQIAFLEGQGELGRNQTADIVRTLGQYYGVDSVIINGQLSALRYCNLLIVAKPDTAFTEKDKYIIDQFIMKGGKVLWCIDASTATMDSLAGRPEDMAIAKDLNLDDMLFHYGVRINPDLLMDLQAIPIPVMTGGYMGNQPVQKMFPWPYFPMVFPTSQHPIVDNLNAVKTEFASSMDTIRVSGVQKTVLLATSKYSRKVQLPARISLDILGAKPDFRDYNAPYVPIAVLLEGTFTSLYKNRIPPALTTDTLLKFQESSKPTKMVVISDGDIIKNTVSKNGNVYPLGYDRYTDQFYGNKNLLLNMIDYMLDDSGLMALRSKQIKLRLLNKTLIQENELLIKSLNIGIPLLIIVIFGLLKSFIRRKRYAS